MGTLNQLLLHVKSFPCLRSRPVRPSDCRLTNSGVLDTVVGRTADSAHGTANRQASGLYPTFSSTTCEPCQQTDGARSIDGVRRGSIAASLRKIILATFRFFAFSHKLGQSLQIVAHRKSLHVRNAPLATVGPKKAACRDGPISDIAPLFDHLVGKHE